MPRIKQASKKKHVMKSVPVLGAAGLTFSMVGGASAAAVPTADTARAPTVGLGHQVTLGEEEIADVSLATFHVFDKENVGSGVQVAWYVPAAVAEAAGLAEAAVAGLAELAVDAAAAALHGALAACAKPSRPPIKSTYADRYGRVRQCRPGQSMF